MFLFLKLAHFILLLGSIRMGVRFRFGFDSYFEAKFPGNFPELGKLGVGGLWFGRFRERSAEGEFR